MNEISQHIEPENESEKINLVQFFGADTFDKVGDILETIEKPILKITEVDITLRNLIYWTQYIGDNINIGRSKAKQKRYSFTQYVWFKMIEQLRAVGYEMTDLKLFREKFFKPVNAKSIIEQIENLEAYVNDLNISDEQKNEMINLFASDEFKQVSEINFSLLHLLILENFVNRVPLSVAVFPKGEFLIVNKSKEYLYTEEERNRLTYGTYVNVSVSNILRTFLRSGVAGFIVPEIKLFSKPLNRLIEVINNGNYDRIVINFKYQKIKSLELTKTEDIKAKVFDILEKGQFAEIRVMKHKGLITTIKSTEKLYF